MVYDRSCGEAEAGGRRRRHWPEAEKRRLVAEVKASGEPVGRVAARHGVHPSLLGRWCQRVETDTASQAVLVPVRVTEDAPPVAEAARLNPAAPPRVAPRVEVHLPGGRRLVVAEDIAPATLGALVGAVLGAGEAT